MTVTVLAPPSAADFPEPIDTHWYTCPPWCGRSNDLCYGGLSIGRDFIGDRLHQAVLERFPAQDEAGWRTWDVEVFMRRNDAPGEPLRSPDTLLRVDDKVVTLTRDERHRLAAALLAVEHIDPTAR